LIAEIRRTEDTNSANLAPIKKLTGYQQGLDCLPDTYVIGDEKADRVKAKGHEQRDELVGSRTDGDATEGPEGPCTVAKGKAGCVPKEFCSDKIS
jgi:hypothetical protein